MSAKISTVFILIAFLALTLSGAATTQVGASQAPEGPAPSLAGSQPAQVSAALRSGPVMFIENVGQFDDIARFYVHGGSSSLWLTEDAIWISIVERSPVEALERPGLQPENLQGANAQPANVKRVNVKLTFPGANPNPRLEPFDRLDTVVSYFIGDDPARWRAAVPVWGGVRYVDLYPGVDLELSGEQGYWSWQWVVRTSTPALPPSTPFVPRTTAARRCETAGSGQALVGGGSEGGGPRLRVEGADSVELLPSPSGRGAGGEGLRLRTALGERVLPLPLLEGLKVEPLNVRHANVQRLDTQTFDITAPFSPAPQHPGSPAPLLPLSASQVSLAYSGFLGGSLKDDGWGIAVDASGDAYVTGGTDSSDDFPAVVGPDPSYNGGDDAFVAKVKADGSGLAYAGFLGGAKNDWGRDIALDASGSAYITGYTGSSNFPVAGELDTIYNGGYYDAFVAKVQADGSGLVYSGFLGGSGSEGGEGIAVDASGNAYVTGETNSGNFPTLGGPDTSHNGGNDAFVTKVRADGTGLVYSGFLGGGYWDNGYGIAVDTSGNAYVTGKTGSFNFPTVGAWPYKSFKGGEDAFVAKVQADGSGLVYSGFLGGSGVDRGAGIAVDTAGNAYITGDTMSGNFPVAGLWPYKNFHGGGYSDAFVAKVGANGNELVYSGFLGGLGSDWGAGIAVDAFGDAYVTGVTGSSDFPVVGGWPYTNFNGGYSDDYSDAFVAKVRADGSGLVYSGFLGGSTTDFGRDIAVEASGNAYVTGRTDSSSGFPVAGEWPYATYNGGYSDAFVAKVVALAPNRIYLPLILR